MSDAWQPEPRPVPEELTEGYRAKPYNDPFLVPVLEKIDQATRERLVELMNYGLGNPVE